MLKIGTSELKSTQSWVAFGLEPNTPYSKYNAQYAYLFGKCRLPGEKRTPLQNLFCSSDISFKAEYNYLLYCLFVGHPHNGFEPLQTIPNQTSHLLYVVHQHAAIVLAALAVASISSAAGGLTIANHLTAADKQRLQDVFTAGVKGNDGLGAYHSAKHIPRSKPAPTAEVCYNVALIHRDSKINEFERSFFAVSAYKSLFCDFKIPPDMITETTTRNEGYTTAQQIYQTLAARRSLSVALTDNHKMTLAVNLLAILRKDDSLTSLGYAFNAAAELGVPAAAVADYVEGAIAQADEIDGKQLQFEGGLSVTALLLNGAIRLTNALKRPAPLTAEQTLKFTTYLLSRRSVTQPKGADLLLEVLATIAQQTAIAPICIQTIGNGQLPTNGAVLSVKIVDVLGNAVVPAVTSVTAVVRLAGQTAPVVAQTALTARSSDATVYSLSLPELARGAYTVHVQAGALAQTLSVRVLGRVKVMTLEIGVGESDNTSPVRKQSVPFEQKLHAPLQADAQQKVQLRVDLADEATDKPLQVHQAFVRFEHLESGEEVTYVAELDAYRSYKFEMDVGARSADFGHRSGLYAVELIVGDASLSNSFRWVVTDVQLKFGPPPASGNAKRPNRETQPEIEHLFRVPEPRPARFVSDLFTFLCCAPLLVLAVLWSRLGVNIANFPCSLSAIFFHAGFAAILTLFGVFFWKLNMFETVRLLVPLALVTFFFGNRLLRSIAAASGKA